MIVSRFSRRAALGATLALCVAAGSTAVIRYASASDHQDTPEVELSPRLDINDVYVFPGSSPDRLVLAVTTSSPLTPASSVNASFDPSILYQIKIDNTGDAVEDLVLQFTVDRTGSNQQISMRGPVAPAMTGARTRLVDVAPTVTGAINTVLTTTSGVQLFAGLREDPFFIDLEQFFKIIPDRRPVTGPLSKIGPNPEASAFRNPGIDFLAGINALGIVVELPESMLLPAGGGGADPKIGVWATTSR
ncbi:MAG TPA: DUF4331 family protein [Gemmatimonadales bacterium]|nr:DUF4331 family protein [Gemmatimonadales bacterium]